MAVDLGGGCSKDVREYGITEFIEAAVEGVGHAVEPFVEGVDHAVEPAEGVGHAVEPYGYVIDHGPDIRPSICNRRCGRVVDDRGGVGGVRPSVREGERQRYIRVVGYRGGIGGVGPMCGCRSSCVRWCVVDTADVRCSQFGAAASFHGVTGEEW